MTKKIDGILLSAMFLNGYHNLVRNMEIINQLNVFPVPDGDTGTNMAKTFGGGIASAVKTAEVGAYMQSLSRGTLLAARGNSGVILSQFISGLAEGLRDKEEMTPVDLSAAMERGKEAAYHAVIQPAEGTILTLIRCGADFLRTRSFDTFENCLQELIAYLHKVLSETPELLPVLKEAGVVDSGGAGLLSIFEGMEAALRGELIEETAAADTSLLEAAQQCNFGPDSVLEYGYCTEFILQLMHAKTDIASFELQSMIDFLRQVGDSIVAVQNGEIVKIHVHTFRPEDVIAYARNYGEFVTFKMENMSVQHSQVVEKAAEKEKYAVIAVVSGEGFDSYFKEIGVSVTISGGQTQNPSTEEFCKAFEQANAEHIVVLPNNSNIILTAQQAAQLYSGAEIHVIPTKTLAEGYSALSMMDLYADTVEDLLESMTCCLKGITTGSVTTATRDTCMNGVTVKKGDHIGLADGRICSAAGNSVDAAMEMLAALEDIEEKQVLTVFYGCDLKEEELAQLQQRVEQVYPLFETGYIYGGQQVYSLIMAIE
ncbi:MAG: DAK2 domain-containing protein [Oscillospiraceae bacterium]|nr:DAK2 domain-containing protein [Oscillospiraceae bacterium]